MPYYRHSKTGETVEAEDKHKAGKILNISNRQSITYLYKIKKPDDK